MHHNPARPWYILPLVLAVLLSVSLCFAAEVSLPSAKVKDKIRGGWVGQTVGCTYGGPTEFRWLGTWIQDYVVLEWNDSLMLKNYTNSPGLYDDLYMDLAFLAVLDSLGPDAPVEAMAHKFANAGFRLWHANQAARWNILNGVMPPESGHWRRNPHADDIDFQIESDFIGLISPGMPRTALEYADKVGHIMNYGDGVYGGVFVSAMYSHAFLEDDIDRVVELALESLPAGSRYAACIKDVIAWHEEWPEDWHRTWFEVEKKWAGDIGCPSGALRPYNIDAMLNGAYIVIGLLYGDHDMGRTIDISTRCGQDSDCNPSNAAGILGTLLGFSAIPDQWKLGLEKVENLKFSYSDYSINSACEVTYRLASELVKRGGGRVDENAWTINRQTPGAPEQVEISFEGLTPSERVSFRNIRLDQPFSHTFQGRAFVLDGVVVDDKAESRCEVLVDGRMVETVTLKGNGHDRRTPLFWYYELEKGSHKVDIRQVAGDGVVEIHEMVIYQ